MDSLISCVVLLFVSLIVVNLADGIQSANQWELIRINLVRSPTGPTRDELIMSHQFVALNNNNNNNNNYDTHQTANGTLNRMNMIRFKGVSYIGHLQVGQPARKFRLLLDSGSGDLWLATSSCQDVDNTIVATYDPKQSTSFSNDGRPVNISYANNVLVSGRLGRELVQFGDLAIEGLTFLQVERISDGRILQYAHIDGILGLSLGSTSGWPDVEAPLHEIFRLAGQQSNGPTKSIISLSLNHGKDLNKAGELIIGGLDESLYVGPISWSPLMRSKNWQFRLDSIELNLPTNEIREASLTDVTVCAHGCDAIADTGTIVIAGNSRDVHALNQRIGAHHLGTGDFVLTTCKDLNSRLPHLSFTISGRRFTLTPSQYTYSIKGVCFSGLKAMDVGHWILGNMFIGHYYAILDYDNRRFGLAESSHKSNTSIYRSD